jgi:hypothetical protein
MWYFSDLELTNLKYKIPPLVEHWHYLNEIQKIKFIENYKKMQLLSMKKSCAKIKIIMKLNIFISLQGYDDTYLWVGGWMDWERQTERRMHQWLEVRNDKTDKW